MRRPVEELKVKPEFPAKLPLLLNWTCVSPPTAVLPPVMHVPLTCMQPPDTTRPPAKVVEPVDVIFKAVA